MNLNLGVVFSYTSSRFLSHLGVSRQFVVLFSPDLLSPGCYDNQATFCLSSLF